MPSIIFNYGNVWQWEDYPNQKVAFDGPNKIIYVNEGVTELSVQDDVYSAWKEWSLNSRENPNPTSYLKAITAIGGDPISDSQNVGTTYFLENGWRIQPFASKDPYVLTVTGNLYTREQGQNPFLFAEGVSVSLTRSNIVDLITIQSVGVTITDQDIANIASASAAATAPVTADAVWDELLADHVAAGSTGQKISKIATKTQDIALR